MSVGGAPSRRVGGFISNGSCGHRVVTVPVEPMGQDDEVADPATLDAAVRQALSDFKDPAGFFSLAEDPDHLDSELQRRYVGMNVEDAASTAIRDGITEIRVFRLPFNRPLRTDHVPNRLNLAVVEGRVIRVAFF